MKTTLLMIVIACLAPLGSVQTRASDQASAPHPASTPAPGVTPGGERAFLRRTAAKVEKIRTVRCTAQTAVVAGLLHSDARLITKRDAAGLAPFWGKVLLQPLEEEPAVTFDGRRYRTTDDEHEDELSAYTASKSLARYSDIWSVFLSPNPLKNEIEAAEVKSENQQEVGGRRCYVFLIKYASGERARWFFDQKDGLPRRVDRLTENEDKLFLRSTVITEIHVNETIADTEFASGRKLPLFSPEAVRHAATALRLSLPLMGDEEELSAYLEEHRAYFGQRGEAIEVARALGYALQSAALHSNISPAGRNSREEIDILAQRTGVPPEIADKAKRDLGFEVDAAVSMYNLGCELVWLSEVLPSRVAGDMERYNDDGKATEWRKTARQSEQYIVKDSVFESMMTVMRQQVESVLPQFFERCIRYHDDALDAA